MQLNFEYDKIFKNCILQTETTTLRTPTHTFVNKHVYPQFLITVNRTFLPLIEQICWCIHTHKAKSMLTLNKNGLSEIPHYVCS